MGHNVLVGVVMVLYSDYKPILVVLIVKTNKQTDKTLFY